MFKRLSFFGIAAILTVLCVANKAPAYDNGYYGGYDWGYGGYGCYGTGAYAPGRLPYYSLYPPVYYSGIERRTFGTSPFAYPPGYASPSQVQPQAESQAAAPAQYPTQPIPLRIRNPFVSAQ